MFWLWQQSPMGLVGLINLDNEFGLAAFWKESSETSTSTVGSSSTSFYYYNAVRAFQMRNGGLVKNCSLPQLSLTVLFPMYHTHTKCPPFPSHYCIEVSKGTEVEIWLQRCIIYLWKLEKSPNWESSSIAELRASETSETLVVLLSKMAKGEYFSSTAKCHCWQSTYIWLSIVSIPLKNVLRTCKNLESNDKNLGLSKGESRCHENTVKDTGAPYGLQNLHSNMAYRLPHWEVFHIQSTLNCKCNRLLVLDGKW